MRRGAWFFVFLLLLAGCTDSQTLAPAPSALDQDDIVPTCPGVSSLSLTAGPSLTVVWGQANDNYSLPSAITYKLYMRKNSESYDLVSPVKIVGGATSTLVSSGVSVGNTYTLFVTCGDEKGNTFPSGPTNERSIAVADSQPPAQIADLDAGSPTHDSILVRWSPSDDGSGGTTASAMRYSVYAATTASVSTSVTPVATMTGTTSYLHTGLNPGVSWYYRVVAIDAVGNRSSDSNEDTSTTLADVTAPSFAGGNAGIVVSSVSASAISLSWSSATDNVTTSAALRYRLYRCSGSTTCDPFAGTLVTTVTGTTSFADTGLNASTVYVYGVRAVDFSDNVSANTDSKITSTTYAATGTFYAYPSIDEVNIRAGASVAVANVVGPATGPLAYPDLLVGAPNASEAGSAYKWTGCVFVFPGTGVGTFSTTATQSFCQPNESTNGTLNGLNFGAALAAGDLDGDGIADVVVSNPLRANVYIFRTQNSAGTLSIGTTPVPITHPSANTTFGAGLCLGNSDGTGALDLFIATTSENCSVACGGATGNGNLLVYENASTAGLFVAPSSISYRISPTQNIKSAGYNIANNEVVVRSCAVGNFDPSNPTQIQIAIGSGTVSFGTGAAADGVVSFFRRTAASSFAFENVLPPGAPTITGNQWGNSLAAIRLSGTTDALAVGAPNDSNVGAASGAVYSYVVDSAGSAFSLTDTGQTFYGGTDFDNNNAGSAVAAFDIWGHADGKQDLVYGAYLDDGTTTLGASALNLGQVFTHRNVAGVLDSAPAQAAFDSSSVRVRTDLLYGSALCKGDVNNDGREDVIVGVPNSDYDSSTLTNNSDVGSVEIYYGVATGEIDFAHASQVLNAPGAQSGGRFGYSCVVMDYNADGMQDLLVGSPYRDVVNTDRGAVYVYFGSANSALPASNSAVLNSPTTAASALFGYALGKGDLDGNGYEDLAVGAIGINSGAANSGRVYVYWADDTSHAISAANMISLDPPSGAYGSGGNPYLANTQTINANQYFGRVLESFPSVNGSAGVDLVVCSLGGDVTANYLYAGSGAATDIGRCWIYEGKVNGGLGGSYTMMTSPKNELRYPSGFSAPGNSYYFGAGMTKGDWNADGNNDLVVCASRQTNLDTSDALAGGCFAYYGTATGGFSQYNGYLPNAAGTRFVPQPDDFHYNPNAETATASRFGEAVLLMDVNNNGSLDLLIGEPYSDNPVGFSDKGSDSGRLYIMRGGF